MYCTWIRHVRISVGTVILIGLGVNGYFLRAQCCDHQIPYTPTSPCETPDNPPGCTNVPIAQCPVMSSCNSVTRKVSQNYYLQTDCVTVGGESEVLCDVGEDTAICYEVRPCIREGNHCLYDLFKPKCFEVPVFLSESLSCTNCGP